jgi:uncharacterized Zn-binding protein involved in type VI secretion
MPAAARIGDVTNHGGTIVGPGISTVLIGGQPAAVAGDTHICSLPPTGHQPTASIFPSGSVTVLIGSRPALRTNFLGSIAEIAAGNIGAAADALESGLARGLSLVISFLAQLLHMSGITDKIRNAIQKIRDKVDAVLLKVAKWIAEKAKRVIAAFTGKGPSSAPVTPPAPGAPVTVSEGFTMLGKAHTLTTTASDSSIKVLMASSGGDLAGKIATLIKAIDDPKTQIRRRERVKSKLSDIRKRLTDYDALKTAYARSLGEDFTQRPPPPEFVRQYTHSLVGEIVQLATNFGFTDLIAQTFLPDPLPEKRYLPEPVKSDIRKRLYERGSAWASVRDAEVRKGIAAIDAEIAARIISAREEKKTPDAEAAMREMKKRGKILEGAALTHFTANVSYVTPNLDQYAVDHDPSVAEHWVKYDGNKTSDKERQNTVEGKGVSKLDFVTRRFNSQKGSRDLTGEPQRFKKHAWISPPFTSVIGKDVKGVANNTDVVTVDDYSLTHEDGTPYLPS